MGDLFLLLLIFLMVAYAFWDELFTQSLRNIRKYKGNRQDFCLGSRNKVSRSNANFCKFQDVKNGII
jgi:hypothetical protein